MDFVEAETCYRPFLLSYGLGCHCWSHVFVFHSGPFALCILVWFTCMSIADEIVMMYAEPWAQMAVAIEHVAALISK